MKSFITHALTSFLAVSLYMILSTSREKRVEYIEGGDILKSQTIDSLIYRADSLHAALYPCEIELNRFQVAFEIFARRNPKGAEQYATIISEETE